MFKIHEYHHLPRGSICYWWHQDCIKPFCMRHEESFLNLQLSDNVLGDCDYETLALRVSRLPK